MNKLKTAMLFIKGVTASLGGALILSQKYPVLTICILGIAAGTIEVLNFIDKSNKNG